MTRPVPVEQVLAVEAGDGEPARRGGEAAGAARAGAPGVAGAGATAQPPVDFGVSLPDSAAEAWRREVGSSLVAGLRVLGPVLLAATGNGKVVALSARTGERYWERGVDGPLRGLVWDRDRIYGAGGRKNGRAFALRLRDGEPVWSREVGPVRHPPAFADGTLYLATDSGEVHALDAASGQEIWRAELPGSAAAEPAVVAGEVLVATQADTLYHLARADGSIRARVPLRAGVAAAPAPWRDLLLVPLHSGELVAYDPVGRVEKWRHDLGAPILATPASAPNGDAYVLTRAADVWRIAAAGGDPQPVARLGGAAVGALAVAWDRIVVGRLDGELFVLTPDGTAAWSRRLGDSVVAPPAIGDGAVYAPLLRGTIVKLAGVK